MLRCNRPRWFGHVNWPCNVTLMDSEWDGVSEQKNSKRASQEIFLKFLVKNYKKLQSASNVTTILVMCMQTNRDMYFYFNSLPIFFEEGVHSVFIFAIIDLLLKFVSIHKNSKTLVYLYKSQSLKFWRTSCSKQLVFIEAACWNY